MPLLSWLNLAVVLGVVLLLTRPIGGYIERVFNGQRTFLSAIFAPVERLVLRCCGIDPVRETSWVKRPPPQCRRSK